MNQILIWEWYWTEYEQITSVICYELKMKTQVDAQLESVKVTTLF